MIRPILRYGERSLHDAASDVATFDDNLQRLIDDMIETMYAAPGVGLAATQVGVPLRLFVVDVSLGRDPKGLIVMINPQFVRGLPFSHAPFSTKSIILTAWCSSIGCAGSNAT